VLIGKRLGRDRPVSSLGAQIIAFVRSLVAFDVFVSTSRVVTAIRSRLDPGSLSRRRSA